MISMLSKKNSILSLCFLLLIVQKDFAQQDSLKVRIALLAPLYIDSAFDKNQYKLLPNYIPQYILSGLDFYNGAMLAVDSLQKENVNAEVFVYDTKDANTDSALNDMKLQNIQLIIASFNNAAEQKIFSYFSISNNIPLISATYPNDAGISANPFFVMLNSTLQTHIIAIQGYLKKYFSKSKIVFITKTGFLENKIKTIFSTANQTDKPLQYRLAELPDNFSTDDLFPLLDSTKQNVIVCGSFNENFAINLYNALINSKSYRATIFGMPDWDGIKELNKPQQTTNISIIYSTPFDLLTTDSAQQKIETLYKENFTTKPSDMVYKGFEAMYHFTHLLALNNHDFINHLSDKDFSVFDHFNFAPVKLTGASFYPDYLENKSLFFIKKVNGKIISVTPFSN